MEHANKTIDVINESAIQISKARDLINYYSQFKLKPTQYKLLELVMAFTDSEADQLTKVTFPTDLLCTHLGMVTAKAKSVKQFHMNKKVSDLCKSLMGTDEKSTNSATTVSQKPWFEEFHMEFKNTVTITLNQKLSHFLLVNKNLSQSMQTYTFDCVNNLNNREAILLYMLLHSVYQLDKGKATFSIDEIKQKLSLVPNQNMHQRTKMKDGTTQYLDGLGNQVKVTMTSAKNFKRVILGQAINCINENTNIFVESTMLPLDVPDTKKTSIQFSVSLNPNYKSQPPKNAKKKSTFLSASPEKIEAITKAEQCEIEELKLVLLSAFGSEGSSYISIIDEVYPESCELTDVVLRCEWVLEIHKFLQKYGPEQLKALIRLNSVSPGLLSNSFKRKTSTKIKGETSKLRNFKPSSLEKIARTEDASVQKISIPETQIVEIARKILKETLINYRELFASNWDDKVANFEHVVSDESLSSKSLSMLSLIREIYFDRTSFAWCVFSSESSRNKRTLLPSLSQIQSELISTYNHADSTVVQKTSQLIKEMVDTWLTSDIKTTITNATTFKLD